MKTFTSAVSQVVSLCMGFAAGTAIAAASPPSIIPLALKHGSHPLAPESVLPGRPPWMSSVSAAAARMRSQGMSSARQEAQVLTGDGYGGTVPPTFAAGNFTGSALAISGDTLAVGAIADGTDVSEMPATFGNGAVYIFKKVGGTWKQVQKVVANDGVDGDQFGVTVAISGDALFVANGPIGLPGNVYIFKRSGDTWSQTQKLTDDIVTPSGAYGFGFAIALQGQQALIANPSNIDNGGRVYAFSESNGVWSQTQTLSVDNAAPNDPYGAGEQLGWSMAIVGSTALIGAPTASSVDGSLEYQGAAYAFTQSNGTWSQAQRLSPCGMPASFAQFGAAVAMDGSTALIGEPTGSATAADSSMAAGVACLFAESDGDWSLAQTLDASDGQPADYFGWRVALKGDLAVIGASLANSSPASSGGTNNGSTSSGTVYAFARSDTAWGLSDEIKREGGIYDHDGGYQDNIGNSALVIDGSAILAASSGTWIGFYGLNGIVDIFDFPAQSAATPAALTLSLATGNSTSNTVQIANAGDGTTLNFHVSDGGTLTQVSDESPADGVGVVNPHCQVNEDGFCQFVYDGTLSTSWYRRFYFNEYAQVGAAATVDSVTVGIERAPAGMPVTINLYTTPHDLQIDTVDVTQLAPIGSASVTADGTSDTTLTIPVDGTIDDTAGKDLVVEYHVDDYTGLPIFLPGANASPQTHATFINDGANDLAGPTYFLGHWSHNLISAHLDPVASGIACANPASTPWLSVSPVDGSIDAGASQDLTIAVDATNLAPGHYSTQVCLATKGPLPSMIQVPVDLTVTGQGGDLIFKDGFDGASL